MEACPYVYNPCPTESENKEPFRVTFEKDAEQEHRAQRVIAYLQTLERDALKEQAIQFFKWTVLYHVSDDNLLYAQRLLAFFHSCSLLQQKSNVYTAKTAVFSYFQNGFHRS